MCVEAEQRMTKVSGDGGECAIICGVDVFGGV